MNFEIFHFWTSEWSHTEACMLPWETCFQHFQTTD